MDVNQILLKLQNRESSILDSSKFLKFAVLLPLIEKDDGLHILFEVRAYNMRRQPGEICFPGGKVDPEDQNEQYTAIRETSEELGIRLNSISSIFPLDYMVTAFGNIIYPFLGVIDTPDDIVPNESEVAEIFTVPLEYFREVKPEIFKVHLAANPEPNFPYELIIGGENYKWQTRHVDEYFYKYQDKVIWGLTARILSHFLEVLE
ncbi:NUDIX hydrolase [Bacillus sp. 1NLA3E]|uniref:NUDIX hydrolase n=1 Tax=Bacillus sp. 1NLA3E TaxID=666686 RepID=UPI000247F3F8|nr:CoA pyrophosphatase [Bacillus sp. 1NLA3E]AGK53840.1 NUDIX family hydrolase [Bacillus sp. 1NLA3E]